MKQLTVMKDLLQLKNFQVVIHYEVTQHHMLFSALIFVHIFLTIQSQVVNVHDFIVLLTLKKTFHSNGRQNRVDLLSFLQ